MRPAVGTALAVLIAAATGVGAAVINHGDHHPAPHPTPTPSVERRIWLEIAQSSLDFVQTLQTMLNSAHATGQPIGSYLTDCQTAVATYNRIAKAAGPDWPPYFDYPLNPSTECQP